MCARSVVPLARSGLWDDDGEICTMKTARVHFMSISSLLRFSQNVLRHQTPAILPSRVCTRARLNAYC
jgi:hypothetical protein